MGSQFKISRRHCSTVSVLHRNQDITMLTLLLVLSVPLLACGQGVVREACLECICQGSTVGCNATLQCTAEGQCNFDSVHEQHWKDLGSRGGSFDACWSDPECSRNTNFVKLSKFNEDCDGDGKVTCADFFASHLSGKGDCKTQQLSPAQQTCDPDEAKLSGRFIFSGPLLISAGLGLLKFSANEFSKLP